MLSYCCLSCLTGKDFKQLAEEIFDVLPEGEVSLEVVSVDAAGMVREANKLLEWAPKVGMVWGGCIMVCCCVAKKC